MTLICRLLFLMVLMLLYQGSRSFLPHKYGELQVNHEVAFVGETVVFRCRVTDNSLQAKSSDIYIRRSGSYIPLGRVVYRDATSVTVNMTVTSVNDTGMYYCTVNTPTRGRTGLGNARVEVEYPLKPVTDFTCVTRKFLTLTCNYTLPVAFRFPDDILGQVLYSLQDYEDPVNVCYNGTDRTFTLEPGHNLFATYQFRVRLLHLLRLSAVTSRNFTVDPMSVGIPSEVTQLKAEKVTSTSLDLSWRLPDTVHNYICKVVYTAISRDEQYSLLHMTNSSGYQAIKQTRLESLIPGTRYTIAVQCRACSRGTWKPFGYFSDTVSIVSKTLDDVPGAAPRLAPAVSRPTDTQLIFYWQPLDAADEHGPLRNYVVRVRDQHGRSEQTAVSIKEHSLPVQLGSPKDEVECSVHVVNSAGPSPASTLTVKALNKEQDPVPFWVTGKAEESRVTFHWESIAAMPAVCTVFWCEGSLTDRACQNPISWKSVACALQNVTIDTGHVVGNQHLLVGFAVNMTTPAGSAQSSIKWDYCIYVPDRVPSAPEGFSLSESQPPLGLQVEWKGNDCRENPTHISQYIISYCVAGSVGCTGPVESEMVSREAVSYLVKGLQATQYRVTIRAVSQGTEGPESIAVITTVEDEANPLKYILPLSAGAVIIFLVLLIVGLRTSIRYFSQRDEIQWPRGLLDTDNEAMSPMNENKPRFSKRRRGWISFFEIHLVRFMSKSSHLKRQSYNSTTDTGTSSGDLDSPRNDSFVSPVETTSYCGHFDDEYAITAAADDTSTEADEFTGETLGNLAGDAAAIQEASGLKPVENPNTTSAIVEIAENNDDTADPSSGIHVPGLIDVVDNSVKSTSTSDLEHQQVTQSLLEGPMVSCPDNITPDHNALLFDTSHSVRESRGVLETQIKFDGRESRPEPERGRQSRSDNSQYVQVGDIFGEHFDMKVCPS